MHQLIADRPTTDHQAPPKALVVGGGVAGPALALFLQRGGIAAEVYEARSEDDEDAGLFLNLGPNGGNVLRLLGVDTERDADGFRSTGMTFYNGGGRRIATIDGDQDERRYGSPNVIVKRARLHRALRDRAVRHGIPVLHRKKLVGVEVGVDRVTARFEDGFTAEGDFLVGADGLHSRVRQFVAPGSPGPEYGGFVDCGGFAYLSPALPVAGTFQMTFGRRAFFGYVARPGGEVCWFSNLRWPQEPKRGELAAISEEEWRRILLEAHADDPEPIPTIIRSTRGLFGRWGVYELPSLPTWHQGLLCLIGDAAHAASPHLGQGASTALEDALLLAKCLRDLPDAEQAFTAFEGLRRARVERIVAQARRNGQQKALTNPLAAFLRDLMLPLFIKLGGSADWLYGYPVDWETPIAGSARYLAQAS